MDACRSAPITRSNAAGSQSPGATATGVSTFAASWLKPVPRADSAGVIEAQAEGDTSFVLGSARGHRHPLVHQEHFVYTGLSAIAQGKAEVPRIAPRPRVQGFR